MFQKMVVAGVGLIGGSLALDMRRRGLVKEIVGYGRTEANLKVARRKRVIDSYFLKEQEIPTDTDFLMLGTPVQTIVPLTAAFLPRLKRGCIVSDVGSVKGDIVRGMEKLLPAAVHFVGAHPDRRQRAVGRGSRPGKSFHGPALYSDADAKDQSRRLEKDGAVFGVTLVPMSRSSTPTSTIAFSASSVTCPIWRRSPWSTLSTRPIWMEST